MYYYAGIGSRKTPKEICEIMSDLAEILALKNYTLRSGGALMADTAFEMGCLRVDGPMEIYLPKKAYKKHPSPYYTITEEAREYASKYHPGWNNLDSFVRDLMARNVYQILGMDLKTLSSFVVCWTPDGCISKETRKRDTGGTGQAISIASDLKIPVYNLAKEEHLQKILNMIEKNKDLPHLYKDKVLSTKPIKGVQLK